jgi:hypothetical protein
VNTSDPRSWPDKLIGLCLGFLLATIAVYVGVQLIVSIWPILLLIIAAVTAGMFTFAIIRYHHRGW